MLVYPGVKLSYNIFVHLYNIESQVMFAKQFEILRCIKLCIDAHDKAHTLIIFNILKFHKICQFVIWMLP